MATCTATVLGATAWCAGAAGWTPAAIICAAIFGGGMTGCWKLNKDCIKGCRKWYPCCVHPDGSRLYNHNSLTAAQAKTEEWVQNAFISGQWSYRWCEDRVVLAGYYNGEFVSKALDLSGYMAKHGIESLWDLTFPAAGQYREMKLEAKVWGLYDATSDTYVVTDLQVDETRAVPSDWLQEYTGAQCGDTFDIYKAL